MGGPGGETVGEDMKVAWKNEIIDLSSKDASEIVLLIAAIVKRINHHYPHSPMFGSQPASDEMRDSLLTVAAQLLHP